MLIDSIIHAQQGCDSDMMFLVSKFSGILKKYARKLNYEDAEQDLTADFIELIHHIDIEKLNNTSDGAIVNFLIRSTYHYYVKRLQKERDRKVPEVYFEDLTPSQSNLVLVQTAVELEESISGYFPSSGLSEREIFILMAVYTYGYSVSDIAKYVRPLAGAVLLLQDNAAGTNLGNGFCGVHIKFNDDPAAVECSGIHIIMKSAEYRP